MAGRPTSYKVTIEFVAGTATDVTADVSMSSIDISTRGRTSPYGTTQASQLTLTLRNDASCSFGEGAYTPGREVLADGVTAHPFYPNVTVRKKITVSYFIDSNEYKRFVGWVTNWPASLVNGVRPAVTLTAVDSYTRLSKVPLLSPIAQETQNSAPALYYPLTEPAGSSYSIEASGLGVLTPAGGGTVVTYGATGPGTTDGTSAYFGPTTQTSGKVLQRKIPNVAFSAASIGVWFNAPSTPAWYATAGGAAIYGIDNNAMNLSLGLSITNAGYLTVQDAVGTTTYSTSVVGTAFHHCLITRTAASAPWLMYVDGVYVGATTASSAVTSTNGQTLMLGDFPPGSYVPSRFLGTIGHVAFYSRALTAAEAAAHYAAGIDYTGDTTGTRIGRWLTAAGLAAADVNLDTGSALVGSYPQAGKSVIDACQDMVTTEGGGAAIYVAPDGRFRYRDRNSRAGGDPALTIDALRDMGPGFNPALDDMSLVNSSIGSRSTSTAVQTTQRAFDQTSIDDTELNPADFTSYATTDADVLALAQWRVAIGKTAAYRLGRVTVDLVTAATLDMYADLGAVEIGSRIRLNNIPAQAAPRTQLDLIVEGWSETITRDSHLVTFDTSPADNPATLTWAGATSTVVSSRATTWAVLDTVTPPVPLGAQTGISRKAAGTSGGRTYINVETIDTGGSIVSGVWSYGAGMSLQTILNHSLAVGKVVTFPANCTFKWSGFNNNDRYGVLVGSGKALGISGSGSTTIFQQVASTTSATSKSLIPVQSAGGTNPLFALVISGVTGGFLLENCKFEYSAQGCYWNGLYIINSPGMKVFNVWFNGFGPGGGSANPDETFELDVYHSANVLVEQCTFDGRPLGSGTAVSASNIGINQISPGFTIKNSITQYAGFGHGITIYAGEGTMTYQNVASVHNLKLAWNCEKAHTGFVWNLTGCQSYSNGNERMVVDSDLASAKVTIRDHVLSNGGTAGVGTFTVRVDPNYPSSPTINAQYMSDIHNYTAGVLNDHFLYNDKSPSPGHGTGPGYYA